MEAKNYSDYIFKLAAPKHFGLGGSNPYWYMTENLGKFIFRTLAKQTQLTILYSYDVKKLLEANNISNVGISDWEFKTAVKKQLVDAIMVIMGNDDPKQFTLSASCHCGSTRIISMVARHGLEGQEINLLGLHRWVWLAVMIHIIVLALVVKIFNNYWEPFGCLFHNVWYFISNLLQNTMESIVDKTTTMFILGPWILATLVLMKAYSGNLKSELLIVRHAYVNSIEDILARKDLKPIVIIPTPFFAQIQENKGDYYGDLLQRLDEVEGYADSIEQITADFRNGKVVIFYDEYQVIQTTINVFYKMKDIEKRLYVGTKGYEWGTSHLYLSHGVPFPILDRINFLVIRFTETAQLTPRLRLFAFEARKFLAKEDFIKIEPLYIAFLHPVFRIWYAGLGISIFFVFAEIAIVALH